MVSMQKNMHLLVWNCRAHNQISDRILSRKTPTVIAFSPRPSYQMICCDLAQKKKSPVSLFSLLSNTKLSDTIFTKTMGGIEMHTSNETPNDSIRVKETGNSSSNSKTFDWSFIKKAYIITCPNADPNSERLNNAKSILKEVDLLNRVEVKEFETDDEDRYMNISALKFASQ